MAYISDYLTISSATKAASSPVAIATAALPAHVADEYLVLAITCEAEATMTIGVTGGQAGTSWTQIGSTVGSGTSLYSAMFYKKCVNASESASIALSVLVAYHVHVFVVKGADTTTFLDGTPSAAYVATASQFNSASITTTQPDSLLLYYIGVDSTTTTPTMCHSAPGPVHFIDSSDNGGASVTAGSKVMAGACSGWYVQRTAGATPTPAWNASLTASTCRFTVGIRNKAGGVVPPYIDDSTTIGTKLMDGHWWVSATTRNNENFKATSLTVTSIITHLGTLTGTFDAGSSVVDTHINPYSASVATTPAASASALTGFELGFPTNTIDMTTGWIVGSLMESGPKLANFNEGTIKTGGTFLSIGKTTNYRIFQIMARDNLVNCEGRAVFSVQANQTQTQSGQSATPPTIASIDKLCILNLGNTTTLAQYCCDFHLIQKITAAGGTATAPVNSEGLYQIGKFLRLKLIQKLGASGLMPMVPIQIGGGDAINFQINAGALQFPRIYDRENREINYHGANNAIGISYAGKSGDVIKHTNSVVTSPSPYYWEINSAATNSCTWDFTGLVVVGANVTLRNVCTFSAMAFSSCPTLNFTDCTLVDPVISKVPTTNNTLTVSATTSITGASINVSDVTAGNYWTSVTTPSIFVSCNFTGGGGHAMRITTPGTYTLNGNLFTGFGATGSTGAAIYNDSGGLVTLNISGGGSVPTYRNGTGATTSVVSGATVTFTGLPTGTDIVILTAGTSTILAQVDQHPATSYAYNYSGTPTVDVGFLKPGYVPRYIRGLALSAFDASIPVSLTVDRTYQISLTVAMTGSTTATSGSPNTYSATVNVGATYLWEITSGTAAIDSGQGTSSVQVSSSTVGDYTIQVTESKSGYEPGTDSKTVTVALPVLTVAMTGSTSANQGVANTYSATVNPGATYLWEVISGTASIDSGQGTSSVQVSSSTLGDYTLRITESKSGYTSNTDSKTVTVAAVVPVLRGSYKNNPTTTTLTPTSGVVVEAGDLIIVAFRGDTATTPTCSDGVNTYRMMAGSPTTTTGATNATAVFYAIAATTTTLTITHGGVSGYTTAMVHVVDNMNQTLGDGTAGSGVLDTYAWDAATGTTTTHTSAQITTTNAKDYLFVFWSQDNVNSITLSETGGPVWNKRQEFTNWSYGGPSTSFDRIVSSTGTYSLNVTSSATCVEANVIVAFKGV